MQNTNLSSNNFNKLNTAYTTINKVVDIILSKQSSSLINIDNIEKLNDVTKVSQSITEFKFKQFVEKHIQL